MKPRGARLLETRRVDGVEIQIVELRWADGSFSFEVIRAEDDAYLGLVGDLPSDVILSKMLTDYLGMS